MVPSRTQLLATSAKFLQACNEWTVDSIMSIRSPQCIHHTGPASVGAISRNNTEFAEFVGPMLAILKGFALTVINDEETLIDVEKRKVMLHLNSRADTGVGPYENEYYFTLSMSEDGEMVDEVVEFLDSGYTADFMRRLQSASPK